MRPAVGTEPTTMDSILLIITTLWAITLLAYVEGLIPYPVGWLVLSVLFFARLLNLPRGKT